MRNGLGDFERTLFFLTSRKHGGICAGKANKTGPAQIRGSRVATHAWCLPLGTRWGQKQRDLAFLWSREMVTGCEPMRITRKVKSGRVRIWKIVYVVSCLSMHRCWILLRSDTTEQI